MANTAVPQLHQWTFDKPVLATRSARSSTGSSTLNPKLRDSSSETLRIDTTTMDNAAACQKENICLQDRYMSSEEGLSPADMASDSDSEYDDDIVIHDITKECQKARTLSVSRWNKGQSCDMAVLVSYAFAGRPKVIELATGTSPVADCLSMQPRSASVAHLPLMAISKLRKADQAQRMSLAVTSSTRPISPPISRSVSPSAKLDYRRPSTSHSPITKKLSTFDLSSSASITSTLQSGDSSRSVTPVNDTFIRPATATVEQPASGRSSAYVPSISRTDLHRIQTSQSQFRQSHIAPPTPVSPASHAFLNTDPFGNQNANANAKPAPHRRLRSISMKLALARIAITPSSKKQNAHINGQAPPTPSSPYIPSTPQTAPLEGMSSYFSGPVPNQLRRASTILRPKSRHAESVRGPSPEMPPVPVPAFDAALSNRQSRMVARGANEREPMLVLPTFDRSEDPMSSLKSKPLRKRKSLMSLM